jgi:sialate O-acetylesterase
VIFAHIIDAEGGLMNRGDAIPHFELAAANRQFMAAVASIQGNEAVVTAKGVDKLVVVRYLFSNTATPTLFNRKGLPVNLFRSDNWCFYYAIIKMAINIV